MQQKKIALQPQWSRIIHRLHSLGKMRIEYSNRIASLSQLGYYPRYIPSSSEDKSHSIDGTVMWNFINWQHGYVKQEGDCLSLEFLSRSQQKFHKLEVVGDADDDCLSCLLKLFGCENELARDPQPAPVALQMLKPSSNQLGFLLEKCVDRKCYHQGVKVELFTEGGVISKRLHFKGISCRNGKIHLQAAGGYMLSIAQRDVADVKTIRTPFGTESTIVNESGMPLLAIKMPA